MFNELLTGKGLRVSSSDRTGALGMVTRQVASKGLGKWLAGD
jgi:hypothetical protein